VENQGTADIQGTAGVRGTAEYAPICLGLLFIILPLASAPTYLSIQCSRSVACVSRYTVVTLPVSSASSLPRILSTRAVTISDDCVEDMAVMKRRLHWELER
jgi:hypothetical protein